MLKSQDIIIFLYGFDGALQESAVIIMRSSFRDDVIIQLNIDAKYRGQDLKVKIL